MMKFLDCSVELDNNVLVIKNSKIERICEWHNGNIITRNIVNKADGTILLDDREVPDFQLHGYENVEVTDGSLECRVREDDSIATAHLTAEIMFSLGQLSVKRVFRIYPDLPVIACDYFLKGRAAASSLTTDSVDAGSRSNIENTKSVEQGEIASTVMERVSLPSIHCRARSVQFYDITDWRNNLVEEIEVLPYRHALEMGGQILLVQDSLSDKQLFMLKEAPCTDIQLNCPPFNYLVTRHCATLIGLGLDPSDLSATEWTQGYGCVTGFADGTEYELLVTLQEYMKRQRRHKPDRDEMIMLNTWGDRSQDAKLGEAFALRELEAGAKLGVTHFQLDDGWQKGVSSNSATGQGSLECIWAQEDYWAVNKDKFPEGLDAVKAKADELGIELCIWFNPSKDNRYANWEKDAEVLIGLYRDYGIRTFKIDGVIIPDRTAELNLRNMLDKVMQVTDNAAVFNLDVTAGKRFGYHYFNEYGNKFLENRYTDWGNYYPHWTLRNLWMLSKYVPAQSLQIEFLNKWRNPGKYPEEDPLAPYHIPFDYCFAITMMAQPLAWFEASHLPEKAFDITPLLGIYKEHMSKIHQGAILPIGNEPDGTAWTGFQSIFSDSEGYLCVYRELNSEKVHELTLWDLTSCQLELTHIAGKGESATISVDVKGGITLALPKAFSFALYRYQK